MGDEDEEISTEVADPQAARRSAMIGFLAFFGFVVFVLIFIIWVPALLAHEDRDVVPVT